MDSKVAEEHILVVGSHMAAEEHMAVVEERTPVEEDMAADNPVADILEVDILPVVVEDMHLVVVAQDSPLEEPNSPARCAFRRG